MESVLVKKDKKDCRHPKVPIPWVKRTHHDRVCSLLRKSRLSWRPLEPALNEFKTAWRPFVLRLVKVGQENAELKREFGAVAEKWKMDTQHWSSVTKMIAHPSYLRIIGLAGQYSQREVERLLLQELQNEPDHWFAALSAISGDDPVKPEYDFDQATEAWLEWGREKGII